MRKSTSVRLVAALVLVPSAALAAEIGTVAATNPSIDATAPGQGRRTLVLGEKLIENARIQSSDQGSGQFLFLDQTSMTVSPLSDFVLDTYVYDPGRETGEIALSMAKGSLRFIGGRVTKDQAAIVRTPTATIGIRGGMALIVLDATGATQAVHLAGQYTTVSVYGDANGDGIDDGPAPGVELGEGVDNEILSRPNASARAGSGVVDFTGLLTAEQLATAFATLEGRGGGGTKSRPTEAAVRQAAAGVAAVNSEVPGGETAEPVSTSGESAADPNPSQPDTDVAQDDATAVDDPGTLPVEPVEPEPEFPLATSGAAVLPGGETTTFDSVARGSLIGTSAAATLRVDVPDDATDVLTPAEAAGFDLPPGDARRGVYVGLAGSFPDGVTPATLTRDGQTETLSVFGFSDLTEGFHYVEFFSGRPDEGFEDAGYAIFGVATPGQAAVLTDHTSDGPDGANALDTFRVQPSLAFETVSDDERPETALLIGNADDSGTDATATRWLLGKLTIDTDDTDGDRQSSSLTVLAAPAGGEVLKLDATAYNMVRDNSGVALTEVSFANLATFADGAGNTLFGRAGEYAVISSAVPRAVGVVVDPGLTFEVEARQDAQAQGDRATNDPVLALLARETAGGQVVQNPLALVGSGLGLGQQTGGAFATGIAQCGGGACGAAPGGLGQVGSYVLTTGSDLPGGGIKLDFAGGQTAAPDTNGLSGRLQLAVEETASGAGFRGITLNFGANGTGAFVDDTRFGATGLAATLGGTTGASGNASVAIASSGLVSDGGVIADGVEIEPAFLRWGWWSANYEIAIAGSGSVAAEARDDVVHLGTWIAGVRPDTEDLPLEGVASYDGFAIGTVATYAPDDGPGGNTVDTRVIGGDFTLAYDFGRDAGQFTLRLPDIEFEREMTVSGEGATVGDYAGISPGESGILSVTGAFFAGAESPIAATGGEFLLNQADPSRQVAGIFGADISDFDVEEPAP